MTLDEAHEILSLQCQLDVGRFYGPTNNLSLGAGLIYEDVRAPLFNVDDAVFDTVEVKGYVFTHECDTDQQNARAFNDAVLICPIVPLSDLINVHKEQFPSTDHLRNFLVSLGRREVSRAVYLPPQPDFLSHGGFLYLNNIASAHISAFNDRTPIAAVTTYGLNQIDQALTNHLLRPKAEPLGLSSIQFLD